MESVIGDWLEVEEDDTGLRVKGKLWAFGDLKGRRCSESI
jgi:hypothetical protein